MPPITLLTDFGHEDAYVGAMKGVLASMAPAVAVIDISHSIPPQAVRRGGLVWGGAIGFFPPGTVHVGVVDPGVGSRRRILAFAARESIFLAPDNGLVSFALERRSIRAVHHVNRQALFRSPLSDTFHGRDIFAPVAARLATGLGIDEVGPPVTRFRWDGLPAARGRRSGSVRVIRGEIVDVDRFGNCITNVRPPPGEPFAALETGPHSWRRLSRSYAAARPGKGLVIVGSMGLVEIAVAGGNAAAALGLGVGDAVVTRWRAGRAR